MDGQLLHEDVRCLRDKREARSMVMPVDQPATGNALPSRFFAVSALGESPVGDRLHDSGISPFRCLDPMASTVASVNFDVIDRPAVLNALAKCDEHGRDEFLKEFGFDRALRYEVMYGSRRYDPKAIVGVAHGYATGVFLRPHQFSGGRKVTSRLEELGFEIVGVSAPH